ncbi:MAG TPA: bifunctional phosphopantothenoylcysteine decarboxylase/phosphopantothenate--cysteine ligase CoaBC [Stellaceae bacterium]|nr:bifunctional phosphopantothenoylcysteine decarboxylase/phosphopantothenate--cysteine ligase CoaBC [Stellaceae bacterium]
MEQTLAGRRILLVISGGIAAYKALDLIRRLRERGAAVRCVMTAAAQHFVTPLAAASLAEDKVYTDLFSLTDESEMGHIRLSREADLVLVAPATADLLARMAAGLANDLASTLLLATDKPVMVAPSMNVMMWGHAATQANMALLERRGIRRAGPVPGDLACGEFGSGRMAEPLDIAAAVEAFFRDGAVLAGKRALVTSGPTWEPIDPVRFIANRSSGKQGHAIAGALAGLGAAVTLVSGPSHEPVPPGVALVPVETAREMLAACEAALPVDVAIFAAAVADWRAEDTAPQKLKKTGASPPVLRLAENPDVLATIAKPGPRRPRLVVGFAAETENILENADAKRRRKGCDWLLANDVSAGTGTFGGETNTLHLLTGDAAPVESWADLPKPALADRLARRIAETLG